MGSEILHYRSVEHFYQLLNLKSPRLDGFGIILLSNLDVPENIINQKVTCEFYCVMCNTTDQDLIYGTSNYEQKNGLLSFVAPNQLIIGTEGSNSKDGWILVFSPKFIKNADSIKNTGLHHLFSYDINKALNASSDELDIINQGIKRMHNELIRNDDLSQNIISTEIFLLLQNCLRVYNQQFETSNESEFNLLAKVDYFLETYYEQNRNLNDGLPNLQYLADQFCLTPKHLSKTLKSNTGVKTTDYINSYIINKAKNTLLASNKTIQEIAFDLGFSQPHYFTQLFKKFTGETPLKYRKEKTN